jgi:Uma2 family endonuclease
MAVEIDQQTTHGPDGLVHCGILLPPNAFKLNDPIIVVEVLSPSSLARDSGAKLVDYFRLPSVRHYLIDRTEDRVVVHHARGDDGVLATRISHDGPLLLYPPGISWSDCSCGRDNDLRRVGALR